MVVENILRDDSWGMNLFGCVLTLPIPRVLFLQNIVCLFVCLRKDHVIGWMNGAYSYHYHVFMNLMQWLSWHDQSTCTDLENKMIQTYGQMHRSSYLLWKILFMLNKYPHANICKVPPVYQENVTYQKLGSKNVGNRVRGRFLCFLLFKRQKTIEK